MTCIDAMLISPLANEYEWTRYDRNFTCIEISAEMADWGGKIHAHECFLENRHVGQGENLENVNTAIVACLN